MRKQVFQSKVFHMTPEFAEYVGGLFGSGQATLAHHFIKAFMIAHGGGWQRDDSPHVHVLNAPGQSEQGIRTGQIFQPYCASQANMVRREKLEARELARG